MSRGSRRHGQMPAIAGRLPPEQAGAIVVAGFITALATVTLDLALAVVLARSVGRGWRERHRGAASAVRAGVNPGLIGLAGALVVHEVVRAVIFRAMIRPALAHAEQGPSRLRDRCQICQLERVQRADLPRPAAGQQASWLNRE
jgi:hypothetical protein